MDTYQIMDALESMGTGRPDRKTIEANIKYIIEDLGYGIVKEKGKPNRYRWTDRMFDLSELKVLVDAVSSSRFISRKNSLEIIAKLKDLTSVHQAAHLNRDIITRRSYKKDYGTYADNIDIITDCINNGLRVSFKLTFYDDDRNEVTLNGGMPVEVTPYTLMWDNNFCYLVGKPSDQNSVSHYRVDKMRDVTVTSIPAESVSPEYDADLAEDRTFCAFGGRVTDVTLSCSHGTMDSMVDVFGTDFLFAPSDNGFNARVSVDTSPEFYAWVFSHNGDIRITAPENVRLEYENMILNQAGRTD